MSKNNPLCRILLGFFIFSYIFYFCRINFSRFYSYGYYDFDLAVHDLTVWNILHGSIFNSILGVPFLGHHLQLILFFIAPVYLIFDHPLVLPFLQTLALGLAVIPLYALAEDLLGANWGLIIGIIYLFYPGGGWLNLYEFHPTAFATLFLILTFYYYEKGRYKNYMFFALLSCICQENISLALAMFGVLAIFNRRSLKWTLAPILLGIIYFLAALRVMEYFNNNTIQFMGIYRHLGGTASQIAVNFLIHPVIILKILSRRECLEFIFNIFLPLSFLPFLNPLRLIPALPFFLQHMLSARQADLNISLHYAAEFIPFVFVSFIYAIKSVMNRLNKNRIKANIIKIILISVLFWSNIFYLGPHFSFFSKLSGIYKKDYLDFLKDGLVAKIPSAASVVATPELLSHLSHRKNLYSFHHIYTGFYTLSNRKYVLPKDAQYALIDFNDNITFEVQGYYDPDRYKNIQKFLVHGDWGVEDFAESLVLLTKARASRYTVSRPIEKSEAQIKNKTDIRVEGLVKLLGYNLVDVQGKPSLSLTFYWECLGAVGTEVDIFLDVVDSNNRVVMRKIHPICYRIYPTNSWQKGQFFEDECRIIIPAEGSYILKLGFFEHVSKRILRIKGCKDPWGAMFLMNIR
ncbi:MAG: DUF2079 domain-containing protein [Candidatus Omnitrophica bacterium]|nr:DUF2079 domain-containing protein [Candidatus Omnitrophota bacterium]